MNELHRIALAFVATWSVLLPVQAGHPNRPDNIPPEGARLFFVKDDSGAVAAVENPPGASENIFVIGWAFDPSDPTSGFVPYSPTYTLRDQFVPPTSAIFAYNTSKLVFDKLNTTQLEQAPVAFGPRQIALFDFSSAQITDSAIGSLTVLDLANAEVTDTQAYGELAMRAFGTLQLRNVTPIVIDSVGVRPGASLIATRGETIVQTSTLLGVTLRDRALVNLTDSRVPGVVLLDTVVPGSESVPLARLSNTDVGKLEVRGGLALVTGGNVLGLVEVFGVARPGDRDGTAGSASITEATLHAPVTVFGSGSLSLTGGSVTGDLSVGDATDGASVLRVFGTTVLGDARAVGRGKLDLRNMQVFGTGTGTALLARGQASVAVSGVSTIQGDVIAADDSTLSLEFVDAIEGGLFLDGNVTLELSRTAVADVGAFGNSTLRFSGGNALAVTVNDGTVSLEDVAVTGRIGVGGKGHLTFAGTSSTGRDIANFATSEGRVSILGGTLGGSLIGTGTSITEMRGGTVAGFALFTEGATFLYSGGTIGNFGMRLARAFAAPSAADMDPALEESVDATLRSDEEEDGFTPLAGFTLLGDAQMKVFGLGMSAMLLDPSLVLDGMEFSVYQLSGSLLDGTPLNDVRLYTQNFAGARFELIESSVPAPDVVVLMGVGLLACVRLRRAPRVRELGQTV